MAKRWRQRRRIFVRAGSTILLGGRPIAAIQYQGRQQTEIIQQQYGYYGKGYFIDVNGIRGLGRINLSEEQLNKINNILTSEQREQLN